MGDVGALRPLSASVALRCTDAALEALNYSNELLKSDGWGAAVSVQPSRTLWSAELPRQRSSCCVQSVRSKGRIRGPSAELLRKVLVDAEFHEYFSPEPRVLDHVVVPKELWVVRQVSAGADPSLRQLMPDRLGSRMRNPFVRVSQSIVVGVPHILPREFVCICGQADLPGDGKLLIEQSIEDETWPQSEDSVRGYRFLAVALHPITRDIDVESATDGMSVNDGGDEQHWVDVELALQLDLGLQGGRFTENCAFEASELISSLSSFLSLPSWPAVRRRLEQEGPRPPARMSGSPSGGALPSCWLPRAGAAVGNAAIAEPVRSQLGCQCSSSEAPPALGSLHPGGSAARGIADSNRASKAADGVDGSARTRGDELNLRASALLSELAGASEGGGDGDSSHSWRLPGEAWAGDPMIRPADLDPTSAETEPAAEQGQAEGQATSARELESLLHQAQVRAFAGLSRGVPPIDLAVQAVEQQIAHGFTGFSGSPPLPESSSNSKRVPPLEPQQHSCGATPVLVPVPVPVPVAPVPDPSFAAR